MLAPAIELCQLQCKYFNICFPVPVQTLQVCRARRGSPLFPSFFTKVTTYKHAFEMHYFNNCFRTVNMQHIVSVEVYSISTINLFPQNYTMSLPTVCVAWNFTAGKDTTYPFNLLNLIFFQQYTFMCILLKALLSHSIHFSGERFGGASTHGEPPLLIPLIIFIITQKPSG